MPATPGSTLPSKNSKDAPPPVEICDIRSAKPAFFYGCSGIAAPDHRNRPILRGLGQGPGHGIGPFSGGIDFKNAHGAIPYNGAGTRQNTFKCRYGCRANVQPNAVGSNGINGRGCQ